MGTANTPEIEDETEGYENGDECPECGEVIEIRKTTGEYIGGDNDHKFHTRYAQCTDCSWNTL